jgi:hypothetical protein
MEEKKVNDLMFMGNESNFSNKLLARDSDLLNYTNNLLGCNSASRPKDEEKVYLDS